MSANYRAEYDKHAVTVEHRALARKSAELVIRLSKKPGNEHIFYACFTPSEHGGPAELPLVWGCSNVSYGHAVACLLAGLLHKEDLVAEQAAFQSGATIRSCASQDAERDKETP